MLRVGKASATRQAGIVLWYSDAKGYGVIAADSGEISAHFSQISGPDGFRTLRPGERVSFDLHKGPMGESARNIVKLREKT